MLDTFTAIGRGETRASNSLNLEDLEASLPGLSLEKSIDVLPGVNVTTTDPFGFYEFGSDVRLRSFRLDQVAVTVDGVPMGSNDPRYGTRATRVVDTENIGGIDVSQGAGDLTTPAYEALGGSIKYRVRMPSAEPEVMIKYTRGDFNAERVFARVDTGEILPGLTAYVSASDFSFRSAGIPADSLRRHMDVVTRYEFEKGFISAQFAYNDRDDYDTAALSYAEWNALENGNPGDYNINASEAATWLHVLAAHGYREYSPFMTYTTADGQPIYRDSRINADGERETFGTTTNTGTPWTPDRWDMGNYSDSAREYGPPTYIDPDLGPGDGVNAIYYDKWRNGRIDQFTRLVGELEITESIKISGNAYYQEKNNYGTWGVDRSAAEGEIRTAYEYATLSERPRTDMWPVMLYNAAGEPLRMDGSVIPQVLDNQGRILYRAMGPEGIYTTATPQPGETFVEARNFSSGHAVVAPGSTPTDITPGVPGRTGRDEDFGGHRYGITTSLEWDITETNTFVVGGWYEHDRHGANRPNFNLVGGGVTNWFAYDQPLFNNYNRRFTSKHMMAFFQDTQRLLDERLTITGGFKMLKVDREIDGILSNQMWRENTTEFRSVVYKDNFLPQIGATFELTDRIELFGNYSENMSAPDHGTLADASGFNSGLSPEYAKNYDLGVRYSGGSIQTSFAVYYIEYDDRVLAVPAPAGDSSFTTGQTTYRNVGGLESIGAEIGFDWRTPIEGLKFVGSIAVQQTEFAEDLYDGLTNDAEDNDNYYTLPNPRFVAVLPPTDPNYDPSSPEQNQYERYENSSGKDMGNTPFLTVNLEGTYRIGDFTLSLGGKYYDDVYINTLNTQEIPSYVLVNSGISWAAPADSKFSGLKLSVNADNLFDEEAWYATSYNSTDGEVMADRGRNVYFVAEVTF